MLISNQYTLDEITGRVVVDTPLGARLLPVGAAGFLHVLLFVSLIMIGNASGEFHLPEEDAPQEIAFMVETYVEPVVEPEETVEEEVIEEPVEEEIVEEEPVIEEEEIAEIIEEAIEPIKEEKPEKPKPRIVPRQVEVKPVVKPVTPPKPKIQAVPRPVRATAVKKTQPKTGFIKPVYPAYLRNPAPPYPKSAKRRRLEGVVELKVQVSADGRVVDLSIAKSCGHKTLDRSALQTVRNWRFLPAKRNGQAVASDVIVPIRFQLRT